MPAQSVDVLVSVGETEEKIQSLSLSGESETTVAILFHVAGATVSLTFGASAFRAFAGRLSRFARGLPGRPS